VLTLCSLGLWEEICVSDWRKLSHGRNVCSDWLNLESFLFTAEHSWTLLAREVRSLDLALLWEEITKMRKTWRNMSTYCDVRTSYNRALDNAKQYVIVWKVPCRRKEKIGTACPNSGQKMEWTLAWLACMVGNPGQRKTRCHSVKSSM
jgi:hypothetical protein